MAVIEITGLNIFDIIKESRVLYINFSSPERKPSIEFTQVFERFSEKHKSIVCGRVKTELEKDLTEGFEITKTPTLMVYFEGSEYRNVPGGCDDAMMKGFFNEILIMIEEDAKKPS